MKMSALLGAGALSALMLGLGAPMVMAEGQLGPYLAGRAALADNDFDDAARYLGRAISGAPENVKIVESAALSYLADNNFDRAVAVAERLSVADPENQLAALVKLTKNVADSDFAGAKAILERGVVNQLIADLAGAWAEVGAGNMSKALSAFDAIIESPGLSDFAAFHKALALIVAGDLEGAEAILTSGQAGTPAAMRDVSLALAEVQSLQGNNDAALATLDAFLSGSNDAVARDLRARLSAGESLPLTAIKDAQSGIARVYYGIASALATDGPDIYTLAYARLAEQLETDYADAILLSAELLDDLGQYELATKSYDEIGPDHPAHFSAEMGRANALWRLKRNDAAIEVLHQQGERYPNVPDSFTALGDLYRQLQRYEEASEAYSKAIALDEAADNPRWFSYYARGITYERTDRWSLAEADFRRALELNPEQPQVLNYLGYSFVEMQENLDEALGMIERAVELRPQDGFITDSLGWVFYRLGRYDDAVGVMERAIALRPIDPTINDHLGDVYWAVGREREAEFQWHRALSFEPEEVDATRIRRKLEVGLDQVLNEEGAPPLAPQPSD